MGSIFVKNMVVAFKDTNFVINEITKKKEKKMKNY